MPEEIAAYKKLGKQHSNEFYAIRWQVKPMLSNNSVPMNS
jgi:hypothetical protein